MVHKPKLSSALHIAGPNLSGWPVWLVSMAFQKQEDHPYVKGDVWEQHIVVEPTPEERAYGGAHWDFSVFDPSAVFSSAVFYPTIPDQAKLTAAEN
jgi:hypothetical protein